MNLAIEMPRQTPEVCKRFGITPKTFRVWADDGMEHRNIGNRIFTTFEAVDRYLCERHKRHMDRKKRRAGAVAGATGRVTKRSKVSAETEAFLR